MNLRPIEVAEGERSNQARRRVIHWREQSERSETLQDEWNKKRRLKQSLRDSRHGLPYLQIPSKLIESGIMAKLKASSLRVYLALISKSHNTRRTTLIGLRNVSRLTGLSEFTVIKSYAELKSFGLIARRRIRNGQFKPYLTTICPPSEWVLPTSNSCL